MKRYLDAVVRQHGYSADWRTCVRPVFEEYEFYVRDPAVCAVPHIDRYNECVRTGDGDCERLLTPTFSCPSLPQELLDWQATCFELD